MNQVLLLNKQVGETPLACIERFRAAHSEYVGVKMTYAGRLDPIAEGLLIVLAGDAVHRKDEYSNLPKVYECVALLGVSTDTYDILGIPTAGRMVYTVLTDKFHQGEENRLIPTSVLESVFSGFVGSFQQAYPPYSSKTVDGRQLHQIARLGEIDTVEIPIRTVSVEWVRDVKVVSITPDELLRQITDTVSRVQGDFRQQQIMDAWQSLSGSPVQLVSFTIAVSSGTYIRGIVNSLGEKLGTGACIMSLKRTSVGEFLLSDAKNFID